ncbi:DHA2 family efflux MFS transporter permease subunit [Paracraurococcus lichenis]|uniref:DHA2 family efflux MFS transporter permease subunit n=1 Tax=Paracraurococcus lichenis TaxID=3064888 RepID=A0ABT9E9J1_9PROT|nr:DHA2 family efflux MFS transporter permease subunit [Paracraurococcus sp. LOR1-02]MDO9712797.1 DHA2 family efflux MFS transporter permease subunit [Paracraurococcus sp. LOR1-02]
MSPAPAVPAPPRIGRREYIGFMAMVFGMFMAILDIQIVSASIAEVQAGLAAGADEASWVQTSYLIAEIVMIPLSGYLSRLLSTRVLFTASAAGFTVFSLLCATASSLPAMVVFRAVQGFLGGAMIPTVFATSFLLFAGPQRIRMSVLIGLTATMAPTIGPTLGGWLTEQLSWHWLFLINIPVGAAVAATVWTCLDIDRPDHGLLRRIDWIALAALAGFLGGLEYVMEEGPRWEWLADPTVRDCAALSALGGIIFFWRTLTRPDPLVELRAFGNRNFAIGCVSSFAVGIGLYGSVYLIPLFLGRVRGYNSLQIGETMFVTGLAMFAVSPIVGRLAQRLDLRVMMCAGFLLMALAVWLTATLTNQSSFWEMALPLGLRGAGTMCAMIPVNQVALGTLPPQMLKNASGLYNLMRNLGGAVGLAAINTLAQDRSFLHRAQLGEAVGWARAGAVQAVDRIATALDGRIPGDADLAALRRVYAMVQREALVMAYNDVLVAMALLFVLVAPMAFLVGRPRLAGPGGGAH